MDVEVKLPELGDGIDGGDVLKILVNVGDTIAKDQNIIEVETDKATVEVPSNAAGKVTAILVSEGQSIATGNVLIKVSAGVDAIAIEEPKPAPTPTPPPTPAPPAEIPAPPAEIPAPPAETQAPPPEPATPPPPTTTTKPESATPAATPMITAKSNRPAPAGPAIRRFAREVGVDLEMVQGTGNGGRITRDDVLEVVRNVNRAAQSIIDGDHPGIALPGEPSQDDWGSVNIENAPKIRRTIAAKMHESWMTVPRVTNFDDADVTELEKIRQSSKADYAATGIKLTSMPFLIKAVSMALRNHPLINASYNSESGQVTYKRYVNVGIAVDTDRGLVVPAMRNTDRMSIAEAAKELASITENVRAGNFSVDDLRGGTFTISNLGAIGGTYSTPIVNIPEVAILLVGRSRKLPVVVKDEIKIRLMMPMSLSYDHRLVDGATAARFLNDVIGFLAAPGRLLIAP